MLYVRLAYLSKETVALCGYNLSTNDGPDHLKFASYGPALSGEHQAIPIASTCTCIIYKW